MSLSFKPILFDSIDVKSEATLIETPDISMVLDPGIAIMHTAFPDASTQKNEWFSMGTELIKEACKR